VGLRPPTAVIPRELAEALDDLGFWFVIGGQAVRCLCPYRPSRDVDLGVEAPDDLEALFARLRERGEVEVLERAEGTLHMRYGVLDVSLFVLPELAPFAEDRRLNPTGILATKMHAILDRGARRDFFDLYVTLQQHALGIAECLAAVRKVFGEPVEDSLLLRALTYFDDAEREAALPGEGSEDWHRVKDFFLTRVGRLLVPPPRPLEIQRRVVDVNE